MAEVLHISGVSKHEKYESLFPQLKSLCDGEKNTIANLANISAALRQTFHFFWVGFYHVDETDNQLVLGPFQGDIACTRIAFGKGVCGKAWKEKHSVMVEDVNTFEGHIACSSQSKSEIVIPIFKNGKVVAVLDIDHDKIATFDEVDNQYLTEICQWISDLLK